MRQGRSVEGLDIVQSFLPHSAWAAGAVRIIDLAVESVSGRTTDTADYDVVLEPAAQLDLSRKSLHPTVSKRRVKTRAR